MINKGKFLSLLLVLVSFVAFGQNRTHTVEKKETKYGISRQYDVSIEDLEKLNPDIRNGLKPGLVLLIPNSKASEPLDSSVLSQQIHKVEAGETLYSLAKKYKVTVEQLKESNGGLLDGLKVGVDLLIPTEKSVEIVESEDLNHDPKYFYHKVVAGETAYSLALKFKITLDSVYILNPEASNGLGIGSEIKFPLNREKYSKQTQQPTEGLVADESRFSEAPQESLNEKDTTKEKFFLYKVKAGDSFFSLRQKFKVSKEELIALNPELESGIELHKFIIMPGVAKKGEGEEPEDENTSWLDKIFNKVDSTDTNESPIILSRPVVGEVDTVVEIKEVLIDKQHYSIVLMLPFTIPQEDSASQAMLQREFNRNDQNINAKNFDPNFLSKPTLSRNTITSIEFYNGFMLAVDTLTKQGMQLDIRVFDTRKDNKLVASFIDSLDQNLPDLVVGPLFRNNVELVADELLDSNVLVVSPLSRTVNVDSRPNLIQCVPKQEAQAKKIGQIINRDFADANIVFAHTGTSEESRTILKIKAHLLAREDGAYMGDMAFTEDMLKHNGLKEVISQKKENVFVVVTEDKVFISDLINKLRQLRDTSITLIASHRAMDMNTLETAYLNKLHLTMADPNFIDYMDSTTLNFIQNFRDAYETEPSSFAYQGYDIGLIFLSKLRDSNGRLEEALQSSDTLQGVFMNMNFFKEEYNGYQNQFLFKTGIRNMELFNLDKPKKVAKLEE